MINPHDFAAQLDSTNLDERLSALTALRDLEMRGQLTLGVRIGPILPSYHHIHTAISYGSSVPGIHSVVRMVWAAHEAGTDVITVVEHESIAHVIEAECAVIVVNRGMKKRLKVFCGVEFRAAIAAFDQPSRRLSSYIKAAMGCGEAAWVVGMGCRNSVELAHLVTQFQLAKKRKAERQLDVLNRLFALTPPVVIKDISTLEGNVTDRALSFSIAKARWPRQIGAELARSAARIRMLLRPGNEAHIPFANDLPFYQELIGVVSSLGMIPVFTAQVKGRALLRAAPILDSWGIRGLDLAGIEPSDQDAVKSVRSYIRIATKHKWALFGGSDYRGNGTGWSQHSPWMDSVAIKHGLARLSRRRSPSGLPPSTAA